MHKSYRIVLLSLCVWASLFADTQAPTRHTDTKPLRHIPAKALPLPAAASAVVRQSIASAPQPDLDRRRTFRMPSNEELRDWIAYSRENGEEGARIWAKRYGVTIRKEKIGDIDVYRLLPRQKSYNDALFVYLHGGAYLFGGGMSGLHEAILIASRIGIAVLSVDYRMPPDYPYPTAVEDVVTVYKKIRERYAPNRIVMGGSSSGGGLTLAVVQTLQKRHITLPAALFVGSPWADLTKTGDSLYVNEAVDRKIVTYDGFIAAAAKLYAHGHDLKESGLSPLYGDFSHFPPTMLVTGTRDLFLSLTVRVHRKLRAANVPSDLHLFEGLSHVDYFVLPESAESKETYRELKRFLDRYLH